ncbi:MAG TPA: metal-dependent hydrolase [Anaerolineales bacterium]|nr:metal-dependent hydrolase [Anaerolineales bacterium]
MSIQLTYFGHSAFQLQIEGVTLLVDPFFTGNPLASVTADQVHPDVILLSHGHGDHVGDAIGIAKRTGALLIANFEIATWAEKHGAPKTHPQHIGGGWQYDFGHVKLTPALHGSTLPDGANGGAAGGIFITTPSGYRIYFAGDTALFSDMALIAEDGIDLAILPIGDNFTMGPKDALKAIQRYLKPRLVLPVHYNTWGYILQDPRSFQQQVESATATRILPLAPGDSQLVD